MTVAADPKLWRYAGREGRRRAAILTTASGRIGVLLALLVAGVLVAGLLRGNPNTIHIAVRLHPPSLRYPFGTDEYGRDQLARIGAGGLQSLSAAALVLVTATVAALLLGTVAGLLGGPVDQIIARTVDVLLAIPTIVLALAVIGALGPGFLHLVFALSIAYIAWFTRMARAFALASRRRDDVTAARLSGISWPRVVCAHVLPDVSTRLWAVSTLALGDIIISIAGLSFLGLGIQPPTAEWGSMLQQSLTSYVQAPWLLVIPGLMIIATVAAVNLIADALHETNTS
jgi:ABC-type dipeptide/oligopeptide/nickel transport system permease subunit